MFRLLTAAAIAAVAFNALSSSKKRRGGADGESWSARFSSGGSRARPGFQLESREIDAGGTIDARFEFDGSDCSGENKSPALDWNGAPEGTKSFALTLYDPDAPTGSGFWHWVVIDIPPHVSGLNADAGAAGGANLPEGARQLRNDYGRNGFGGVCPPRGDRAHRYVFTLYALDVDRLDIPDDASCAMAGFMIHANSIAKTSFSARYGRPAA